VTTIADEPASGDEPATGRPPAPSTGAYARLIAAGILLSRIAGLIREAIFSHYFGTTLYASAFRVALRMPNALQNLLGEGTLSASFIPVYAELLERGEKEQAGRVAGAIFALLLAVAGGLALFGVLLAPVLVSIFFAGATGELREVTIACTRIIFPMTGVLVLSAWALGVLNSHRKFFVSYFAPVLWNAAMIATLVLLGGRLEHRPLVIALAWGALAGGALQFLIQLPWVLRLERELRFGWRTRDAGVRTVIGNAGPAVLGRGVVQLSTYVDMFLASFLFVGAAAALGYAQTIYILPYSLFGMSVAAAELPELARRGLAEAEALRRRVGTGLRQIALFIVPSTVGFLTLGDVIVGALYQRGDFVRADTMLVYLVLAGYTLGLVASTATRLYVSAFYALKDTRTPAKVALVRVVVAGAVGLGLMRILENYQLLDRPLGVVGLSVAGAAGAWVEWAWLRRTLGARIGDVGAHGSVLVRMAAAALAGAAAARGLLLVLPALHPVLLAGITIPVFAAVYFVVARALGVEQAAVLLERYLRRLGLRRR
jgi:putative peptidoglycan lipid II flippase